MIRHQLLILSLVSVLSPAVFAQDSGSVERRIESFITDYELTPDQQAAAWDMRALFVRGHSDRTLLAMLRHVPARETRIVLEPVEVQPTPDGSAAASSVPSTSVPELVKRHRLDAGEALVARELAPLLADSMTDAEVLGLLADIDDVDAARAFVSRFRQKRALYGGSSRGLADPFGLHASAAGLDSRHFADLLAENRERERAEDEARAAQKAADASQKFLNFDWSVGLGVSYDMDGERIGGARVVDGIIRVEWENRLSPRIVLEAHYFFPRGQKWKYTGNAREPVDPDDDGVYMKGHGPFIGIQTSGDNAIDGFGAGWMWGWRRNPENSTSFNLGFGVMVDTGVQVLGDGLEANEPLPSDDELRFKKEDRWGPLFLASFSF